MKNPKYLYGEDYYNDTYDLHTIKECLDYYQNLGSGLEKSRNSKDFEKYTPEKFDRDMQKVLNVFLYTLRGERYRNKETTIKEWLNRDRKRQEKYDRALPPNVPCKECGSNTEVTLKDWFHSYEDDSQIFFMLRCVNCNRRQAFYEDGTDWIYESSRCPKCSTALQSEHKDAKEISTTVYTCPECPYTKKDVYDFKKAREERKQEESRDKKLLTEFRSEFCLSAEAGKEYIELAEAMEVGHEVYEEELKKYDSYVYQRSAKLKKISVVELEKILSKALEKEKYINLAFDKPEMKQQVIVSFIMQDADSSRTDKVSESDLQKLIIKTVENTNWRLMSEGVRYRLGYLSGRLKGYEGEEAMFELSKTKKEVKKTRVKSEQREKYEHHNVVQLAKLQGKMKGIENVRKHRLEKNPEGFFLEESEGPLTCCICRETTPGNKIWWTWEGLYCSNCWRNIKEGVIPKITWDHDNEVWFQDWQIKSDYSIHPSTRRRLERQGVLKGRILKRQDGSEYCTVYLIEENQKFLKKYPRRPEQDIKLYWSDQHKSLMLDVKKNDYSKDKLS